MTERTGILNISGAVMEDVARVRSCPGLRVSIIDAMAAFAAVAAGTDDADVEARVAAGSAGLAMAGLAFRQIRLGIGTMIAAEEIAAVKRVWRLAGAVRMTALAVEAG